MDYDEQGPSGGVTPYLIIPGGRAAEAIDFYCRAFGAEEQGRMDGDDGRLLHAHLRLNGGSLLLADDFPHPGGVPSGPPAGFIVHLQVADADALWARATEAGAEEVMPLEDQFWGDRYGQLRDPFGVTWSIGAPAVMKQD